MTRFAHFQEENQIFLLELSRIINAVEGQKILEIIVRQLTLNFRNFLIALSAVELIDEQGQRFLQQGLKAIAEAGAECVLFPSEAIKRLSLNFLDKRALAARQFRGAAVIKYLGLRQP